MLVGVFETFISETLGYGCNSVKQAASSQTKRYGPMRAAWTALLYPVKAVQRADHLRLGWAWLVHAVGMVAFGAVLLLLAAWDLNHGGIDPEGLIQKNKEVTQALWGVVDDPRAWVAMFAVILGVESAWALSAAVSMSWCSRDEPYRDSYVRALRRLMLLTPHLVTIVGFLGGVFVIMHNIPGLRRGLFNGLNPEGVLLWLLVFAPVCLWTLWVVLKALGVHGAPAMCRWPLRCEGCGYALTGMDYNNDCPECGRAINQTLNLQARPGIEQGAGFRWWISQTCRAIRRPRAFGRRMQVMSADTGHRRCLGMTVGALMLLTPAGIAWLALVFTIVTPSKTPQWGMLLMGLTIISIATSLMIVATTAGATLLIAVLAGVTEGRHLKRNLMPVAMRAAGYLSGFAVIWAIVFWCSMGVTLTVLELNMLPAISARYNIAGQNILAYWHYGITLIGILIYGVLIDQVTRAARYANW